MRIFLNRANKSPELVQSPAERDNIDEFELNVMIYVLINGYSY